MCYDPSSNIKQGVAMKSITTVFFSFVIAMCGVACSNGSQSNPNNNGIGFSDGNDSNYTLVVYYPGTNASSYYNDLLTNITTKTANIPVSRILLSVQNPYINPDLYQIGSTIATSGLAVQFLANLAKSNAPIQVYAYPNVESDSAWESWVVPTTNPEPASCTAANNQANTSQQQDVLKSICWANLVNQLINSTESATAINGVAYDGQEFILGDADDVRAWLYSQTSTNSLLLGWVSGGLKSSVDLNLIEVYNVGTYNKTPTKVDEIEPQKVTSFGYPSNVNPVCNGTYCSYTGVFPGIQWASNNNGKPNLGAVGGNIYQCALSNGNAALLSANSCDSTYSTGVTINATPDAQMLQSFNYIYFNTPYTTLNQPIFYGSGSAQYPILPKPTESDTAVVFLFSTEYIGPMKSYYGTGLQCSEANNNCSCLASLYNPKASCGDGNNFGSWGNNLGDFKNFSTEFLTSQEIKGACPAPGGCAIGIYMYDFIPQQWYK